MGTPYSASKQRKLGSDSIALFGPDCIFCNKSGSVAIKKGGSWSTEYTTTFQSNAWKTVLEFAEMKCDEKLLTRIRDVDLFAAEAKFHPNCRNRYVIDAQSLIDGRSELLEYNLKTVHKKAFVKVCERVEKEILHDNAVVKLADLHSTYIAVLENTNYSNPEYRSEK